MATEVLRVSVERRGGDIAARALDHRGNSMRLVINCVGRESAICSDDARWRRKELERVRRITFNLICNIHSLKWKHH
jgi:hypothetical protein